MITNIKKRRSLLEFIAFTAPAIILILLMSEIPFILNLFYAFTEWNGVADKATFIGYSNFIELFTDDPGVINAGIFTLKFSIFNIVFTNVIGLFLAVMLNKGLNSNKVLRTIFFMPNVLSMLVIAFMFRFIYTKGFDSLYQITGLDFFNWSWLGDIKLAFYSVAAITVWQKMGYIMVIYIAGIQSIPNDVIEASIIDGSNSLQRFFKISLPLIMPSITVCLFLTISNALNVFDIPFALTNGGPGDVTTGAPMNIYKEAFLNNRFGYGTAKSIIYFVIVLITTFAQVRFTKDKEVEV